MGAPLSPLSVYILSFPTDEKIFKDYVMKTKHASSEGMLNRTTFPDSRYPELSDLVNKFNEGMEFDPKGKGYQDLKDHFIENGKHFCHGYLSKFRFRKSRIEASGYAPRFFSGIKKFFNRDAYVSAYDALQALKARVPAVAQESEYSQ